MSRELLEKIDDFRYSHRIPSRAEAMRRLVEVGLRHTAKEDQGKQPVARS